MKALNGTLCQACWLCHTLSEKKKKKYKKLGFPVGSDSKEPTCNARVLGSVPGFQRSLGERNGNPLQYFCLENLHGQRSLADYSPWGRKESETIEQQHFHFLFFIIMKDFIIYSEMKKASCKIPCVFCLHFVLENICMHVYNFNTKCLHSQDRAWGWWERRKWHLLLLT